MTMMFKKRERVVPTMASVWLKYSPKSLTSRTLFMVIKAEEKKSENYNPFTLKSPVL